MQQCYAIDGPSSDRNRLLEPTKSHLHDFLPGCTVGRGETFPYHVNSHLSTIVICSGPTWWQGRRDSGERSGHSDNHPRRRGRAQNGAIDSTVPRTREV